MKKILFMQPSPWPARLDLIQSISGLLLALFMWFHMLFVSSILIGKDAFWIMARFFEGHFFFSKPYPIIVSILVAIIFTMIVIHAILALRKFPSTWQQYRNFSSHMVAMNHSDTTLWMVQVITGFAMFFLASVHLYEMMMEPELIDPYGSADLVWSGHTWPLLMALLICVEIHGSVGLYRLALKWGWPTFGDMDKTRQTLKRIMWSLIVVLLGLGFLALSTFMRIGKDHASNKGQLYTPSWENKHP
ncbi:fumarate reductase [Achromatium sp. WMS3]|nr:fumarate reductase [Achromatium sp. WMS3]